MEKVHNRLIKWERWWWDRKEAAELQKYKKWEGGAEFPGGKCDGERK